MLVQQAIFLAMWLNILNYLKILLVIEMLIKVLGSHIQVGIKFEIFNHHY